MAFAMFPLVFQAQVSDSARKPDSAGNRKVSHFAFDWRKGMIFVPVRINGSSPLAFVLDTGSTKMLLDSSVATALGLKPVGAGSLQGAGAGSIATKFIHDVSIGLPGIDSAGYEFSTADLEPLRTSLGVKVDGILGYEFLSRFVVTVDFESRNLTVVQPEAFHSNGSEQELPIELRNKWPFVKGELVLPGPVTVQDSFLIDSGSSDAVDHPIVMDLQSRVASTSGVGIGTPIQGATARATSFRLGRYSIAAPIVSCCGATDATSRLIGNDVLQRFTVTFDYPSSRIFLAPNAHFPKSPDRN